MEEDRISAVQYVRFVLEPQALDAFGREELPVRLCIDHPNYRADALLPEATRRELLADLRGDEASLLPPPLPRRAPEPLLETAELRVLSLATGEPWHLVVELRREGTLSELPPEALTPGLAEVQRRARELRERHGGCRVEIDAAASPVRWHLLPPR